ncbi:phage late control D family protein [Anaerotignum sp.]
MEKMKTRQAKLIVGYIGREISADVEDFSFTDVAGGSSDSLSISVGDKDGLWIDAWMPQAGDMVTAAILIEDWKEEGDERNLFAGEFTVDDVGFSGEPVSVSIGAVSKPADDAFSSTKRSQTWENVTLKKIAQTIAGRYNLALVYDAGEVPILAKEQSEEEDGSFLKNLCENYGLMLKIYRRKLVIYDREIYKKKPFIMTIDRSEMGKDWSFERELQGSYTGGKITYTDPKTEKDITFSVGTQSRPLEINEKADNAADAERIITAKVANANHGMEKLSFSVMGEPKLIGSQTIWITGFGGKINGKYFIDEAVHTISRNGGYRTKVTASKNDVGSSVDSAIDFLVSLGIIVSPDYWKANYGKVKYLDLLLCNMAAKIKSHTEGGGTASTADAISKLAGAGVINTPEYWTQHQGDLPWIGQLLQNAANAL